MLCLAGLARGATLSGSFSNLAPGTNIDLTAEGTLDWAHWGFFTEASFHHKYGVARQISWSYTSDQFLTDGPYPVADSPLAFNWSNGTPLRLVTNTATGIEIYGDKLPGNGATGFLIECRADTHLRHLKLYVGTSGAAGTFTASLSGAPTYTDNSLNGATGPVIRVYTLDFQADAPGQTLAVSFMSKDTSGSLRLYAATLTGYDVPPVVTLTAPPDNSVFAAPANFWLTTAATDSDGVVTNITLLNGATLLAQAGAGPLSLVLADQGPNTFHFSSVATDDRGLSVTSFPITVYVVTNGGTLLGSVEMPPSSNVDLTVEGRSDWAHWGLLSAGSFDRKAGVPPLIPDLVPIHASTNSFNQYSGNRTAFSWSDGTPTASAVNSDTGIFIYSTNDPPGGFRVTVPATNSLRRLRVYVGLYGVQGRLQAALSDRSAPPYLDSSLAGTYENGWAVYTLTYASLNPGASLEVSWLPLVVREPAYGNVTWQAATLAEPPALAPIPNQTIAVGLTLTLTNTTTNPYGDPLTFTLGAGAATNAVLDPATGRFTWTPTRPQRGTNRFSVIVSDQSQPPMSTTQSFNVTAVITNRPSPPHLSLGGPATSGQFRFSFYAEAGGHYTVQFTDWLAPALWQVLTNFDGQDAEALVVDSIGSSAQRFYRVQVE